MCRAITCRTCGRTTWAGCGNHVEQVRRSVPADRWCPGHPATGHAGDAGAPGDAAAAPRRPGLIGRLLRR